VTTTLLFLLIALSSSYLFYRLRVPAGSIIGPIFIFAAVQFLNFNPALPGLAKTVLYSIFGAFFATKIASILNTRIKPLLIPVGMTILWYLGLTVFSNTVLRSISGIHAPEAFISVIPGGIAEMNILALSYQADVSIINSFHLARLFTIIIAVPAFIKAVFSVEQGATRAETRAVTKAPFFQKEASPRIYLRSLPIFAVGALGSLSFLALHIPAGSLMGSLVFVVIFELLFKRTDLLPHNLYTVTLSLLGGIIGSSINIETFGMLSRVLTPVLVITAITVSSAFLLAFLLHALLKKSYLASLLGVMPGGLAVMLSLAESTSEDIFYVTVLQIIRLLTAVLIIPNLLLLFGLL